eukprot:4585753-Pyramimonas_sp.AAC.1
MCIRDRPGSHPRLGRCGSALPASCKPSRRRSRSRRSDVGARTCALAGREGRRACMPQMGDQ